MADAYRLKVHFLEKKANLENFNPSDEETGATELCWDYENRVEKIYDVMQFIIGEQNAKSN